MSLFIVFALLLTGCAVALITFPLLRKSEAHLNAPVAATVMAVVLPALVLLLYVSVSNHSWNSQSVAGTGAPAEGPSAVALDQAVATLEERLRREPDDVEGWLLLGRTYFELQDIPKARSAFAQALALNPGTDAKLGVAEADIIIDRNSLTGDAGRIVEEVLLQEPNNAKALFYGGLVALARQDLVTLQQRWERLLTLSPPPAVKKMIEEQLAVLEPEANAPVKAVPISEPGDDIDDGINVRVDIADHLAEKIKPGAMLFLVAREPDKPGPPVAAVRQGASGFPILMRITDANAMLPGKSLAAIPRVHLLARIANGGDPIAQPGDIFGELYWIRADDKGQSDPVSILLDRVVD
jgi:cytochrome c-type biogenesis protein CcmH